MLIPSFSYSFTLIHRQRHRDGEVVPTPPEPQVTVGDRPSTTTIIIWGQSGGRRR